MMIPPCLPNPATLGIVSPSSPGNQQDLDCGLDRLRSLGHRLVLGDHLLERRGHLAGTDAQRAADLRAMFLNPRVDAILCARGGSGAIRLLPLLDFAELAAHPKPFLGYSDITILHLALLKAGLAVYFSPMVTSDFHRGLSPAAEAWFWEMLSGKRRKGPVNHPDLEKAESWVDGVAEGPITGGTLSLVVATLGTPWEIETRDRILFLEDVHESPARIERYLAHLHHAGKLEEAAGFLVGTLVWDADPAEQARYLSFREVVADYLLPLGKPVVYGWPTGHQPNPMALPFGIPARLHAANRELTFLEPTTRPQ